MYTPQRGNIIIQRLLSVCKMTLFKDKIRFRYFFGICIFANFSILPQKGKNQNFFFCFFFLKFDAISYPPFNCKIKFSFPLTAHLTALAMRVWASIWAVALLISNSYRNC